MEFVGLPVASLLSGSIFVAVLLAAIHRVIKKAGYSGWWTLAMFIPLVNFILIWVFSLRSWPNQKNPALAEKSFTDNPGQD